MVRLIPFNQEAIVTMVQWAEREDMKDFFRRIPPVMTWCDIHKAMQLFGHGYLVTVAGETVGYTVIDQYDPFAKSAEFSVIIDQQRIANRPEVSEEAAVQTVKHAFDYMNCEKVYCKIMTTRKTLCERLQSYGFVVEGLLRKSIKGQNEWLLGCLKDEFKRGK